MGVDCSNTVDHDGLQVLSYNTYSLFILAVVGIEPADDFTQKHFWTKQLYPLSYVSSWTVTFVLL